MALSGTTMSLKKMAASTPWRRTGCSVISVTRSGRMHDSSIGMPSRTARYSGSERPAWRMNHTGVRVTDSRRAARTRSLWRVSGGAVVGTGQSCHGGRVAPRHAHPARPEDRSPDSGIPSSGAHANVAGQPRRGLRQDAQRPARRPSALRGAADRGAGADAHRPVCRSPDRRRHRRRRPRRRPGDRSLRPAARPGGPRHVGRPVAHRHLRAGRARARAGRRPDARGGRLVVAHRLADQPQPRLDGRGRAR